MVSPQPREDPPPGSSVVGDQCLTFILVPPSSQGQIFFEGLMDKVSTGLGSVFMVKLGQRHRTLRPAGAAWLRTCTERKLKPCGGGGLLAGAKTETQWFRDDNFRHAPSVVNHVQLNSSVSGLGSLGGV